MVSRTISHATRGVLYAEAGSLDEAEQEFQTHLELRPAYKRVKEAAASGRVLARCE